VHAKGRFVQKWNLEVNVHLESNGGFQ
jgi:hypothetical protein